MRKSKQICSSLDDTPENRAAVNATIARLERSWNTTLCEMPKSVVLWAAESLAAGDCPGLDAACVRRVAAIGLFRELLRRWDDEARWGDAVEALGQAIVEG